MENSRSGHGYASGCRRASRDCVKKGQLSGLLRGGRSAFTRRRVFAWLSIRWWCQGAAVSSSRPLTTNDIQDAFTRFHEQGCRRLPCCRKPAVCRRPGWRNRPRSPPNCRRRRSWMPMCLRSSPLRRFARRWTKSPRNCAADDVYLLVEGSNGYRLVTHPRFARDRILRDESPPGETVAVRARDAGRHRLPPGDARGNLHHYPCLGRSRPQQASNANWSMSSAARSCPAGRSTTARRTHSLNLSASSRSMNCPPPMCCRPARSTSGCKTR